MTVLGTERIVSPLTESELSKKSLCDYVINIATGCLHGCTFCFVPSTPVVRMRQAEIAGRGVSDPQMDWGDYLFVREEVPEKLEEILSRKRSWKETESGRGVVLLCSGTDPYQNKATAKVTRKTVEVLLKYGKRVRILTRSPLWVNDLDILVNPLVTVGMSLPHLDDRLSRQVEPKAPSPSDRLKALAKGKEAGCRIFIAMAPTVPAHGFTEFYHYFQTIHHLRLEPEVIFWEPINARGTNGKRMVAAGLDWAGQVMSREAWARNFIHQWQQVERAAYMAGWCEDLIHIWVDPELPKVKLKGFDLEGLCCPWFSKPTLENW
jgi:DNA repair photolyase